MLVNYKIYVQCTVYTQAVKIRKKNKIRRITRKVKKVARKKSKGGRGS